MLQQPLGHQTNCWVRESVRLCIKTESKIKIYIIFTKSKIAKGSQLFFSFILRMFVCCAEAQESSWMALCCWTLWKYVGTFPQTFAALMVGCLCSSSSAFNEFLIDIKSFANGHFNGAFIFDSHISTMAHSVPPSSLLVAFVVWFVMIFKNKFQ